MQPQLNHFLARYAEHQQEQAAKPTPEMEFMQQQFSEVVSALESASSAMVKFMQTYHPTATVDNFPKTIKTPDMKQVVTAVNALGKTLKPAEYDNTELVKGLKSIQSELKQLPKSIPDTDEAVVHSVEMLGNKLESVLKAIQAQELKSEVNVAPPDLKPIEKAIKANKPDPVDFKDVIKALKEVQKEVRQKPVPGTPNVPTDPLIYYLPMDVDDAGTVQYFGYTDNKGAWYIKKFDQSVSPKTIRLSFGQSNYATNWTNRASLTYSIWGS